MKRNARKVRRLFEGKVLAGFAGGTRRRASRSSRSSRRSSSSTTATCGAPPSSSRRTGAPTACCAASRRCSIVADRDASLLISGTGDVIEPDDGVIAIGSGGNYALAAARALVAHTALDARAIAEEAMRTPRRICVYTNDPLVVEELTA